LNHKLARAALRFARVPQKKKRGIIHVRMEAETQIAPKVTALVVSHNNAAALRRCLQALEASRNRAALEILVVDNGSWDDSPKLEAEFPKATFMRIPRNFGKTKALNVGIRTAAGELLFFLSPEVEVAPDTVIALSAKLEATPEAVAVCPLLRFVDGEVATRTYPAPSPAALFAAWRSDSMPDPVLPAETVDSAAAWVNLDALIVSKYFIKGLNYFDERYGEYLADAELSYQIRRAGRKILILGETVAILHKSEPPALNSSAQALLSADFLSGIAAFAGKHQGFLSGLGYRVRAILFSLGSLLVFQNFGYRWKRFAAVAGARKVDGSQSEAV
jgi:GT2 family glycosyltransferase